MTENATYYAKIVYPEGKSGEGCLEFVGPSLGEPEGVTFKGTDALGRLCRYIVDNCLLSHKDVGLSVRDSRTDKVNYTLGSVRKRAKASLRESARDGFVFTDYVPWQGVVSYINGTSKD